MDLRSDTCEAPLIIGLHSWRRWLREACAPAATAGAVMASAPDQHPLVRKLESITDLTPEERQALLDLPMKVQPIGANQDIVREGDRPSRCCLVLKGFVCRYKMTLPGKRQIMAFHVPGDIPDLQSLHLK